MRLIAYHATRNSTHITDYTDIISLLLLYAGGPNIGKCSDSIYYNCMDNIAAHGGDFAVCNMCMCADCGAYYHGEKSCGADPILYTCFISNSTCQYKLRQAWVIGFSCSGVFFMVAMSFVGYSLYMKYSKEKRVAPYKPSHRRMHRV
jgi:hypothetical protein